jgi:hypothetical protein
MVKKNKVLKQINIGNIVILKIGNRKYATILQNINKEFNWCIYFQKGITLSGYDSKDAAIQRAYKMNESFQSVFNNLNK